MHNSHTNVVNKLPAVPMPRGQYYMLSSAHTVRSVCVGDGHPCWEWTAPIAYCSVPKCSLVRYLKSGVQPFNPVTIQNRTNNSRLNRLLMSLFSTWHPCRQGEVGRGCRRLFFVFLTFLSLRSTVSSSFYVLLLFSILLPLCRWSIILSNVFVLN